MRQIFKHFRFKNHLFWSDWRLFNLSSSIFFQIKDKSVASIFFLTLNRFQNLNSENLRSFLRSFLPSSKSISTPPWSPSNPKRHAIFTFHSLTDNLDCRNSISIQSIGQYIRLFTPGSFSLEIVKDRLYLHTTVSTLFCALDFWELRIFCAHSLNDKIVNRWSGQAKKKVSVETPGEYYKRKK